MGQKPRFIYEYSRIPQNPTLHREFTVIVAIDEVNSELTEFGYLIIYHWNGINNIMQMIYIPKNEYRKIMTALKQESD